MLGEEEIVQVLPRGRHRLTRREVAASQRGRVVRAMVAVVAERGYADTSVAAVVRHAGVSTKAFYAVFSDKEDCFLAAYDLGVRLLRDRMRAALEDASAAPLDRVGAVLDAYLATLAAEPEFARAFLIEVYGAGPEALHRRLRAQDELAGVLAQELGVARDERGGFACAALAGALVALVTERVGSGALGELAGLRAPLVDLAACWVPAAAG